MGEGEGFGSLQINLFGNTQASHENTPGPLRPLLSLSLSLPLTPLIYSYDTVQEHGNFFFIYIIVGQG